MRKITQESIQAFMSRNPFRKANMEVKNEQVKQPTDIYLNQTRLLLHGNTIAVLDPHGLLFISSAGWRTNTTKERLNGLDGVRINQKDFTWYLNGQEWANHEKLTCVNTWPNPNPMETDYTLEAYKLN